MLCRAKEVYEFAYTYPYSYTELQKWLLGWERLHLPYLQRHLLCRTPQMKRVEALIIEESYIDVGQSCSGRPMSGEYAAMSRTRLQKQAQQLTCLCW